MRVFAIILLMGCLSMGAWCQDVLVTRDGVRHDGFVTEENKDHVTLRMRSEDGSVRDTTIVRSEIYDLQFGVTEEGRSAEEMDNRTAVSAGLWVAGSSVAGVELERMLGSRWSVMAGAGVAGASAGVGCHFQRTVNSGLVAARWWMNGFGNVNNVLGMQYMAVGGSVTLRAKHGGWFGEVGVGGIVKRGPAVSGWNDKVPVCVRLSGGWYWGF